MNATIQFTCPLCQKQMKLADRSGWPAVGRTGGAIVKQMVDLHEQILRKQE